MSDVPAGGGPMQVKVGRTDQALYDAPVIQIDGAQVFIVSGDIVKFNLYQDRALGDPTDKTAAPLARVVCARLVMAPTVARQIGEWLVKNTASFEKAEGKKS